MELKTLKEKMSQVSKSKYFNQSLIAIGLVIWTGLILQLGMFIGYQKASYFFKYGDNYYKNLRGGRPMPMGLNDDDLPRSHGAIGRVIQVTLPTFIVEDEDGMEKIISTNDRTIVRNVEMLASTSKISQNDMVVVVGSPNEKSEIEAKLIRILPPLDVDSDNQ
ncbi:MAG: hypothetical protein V4509_05740 [Patescibacteria group bacterium]